MYKKISGGMLVFVISLIVNAGSVSADTLIGTYNTSSTPAISTNSPSQALVSDDLLYVIGSAGVDVVDTAGTVTFTDDAVIDTYSTASTPALPSNVVRNIFLSGDVLYIGTNGDGLTVIDTNGTGAFGDDTLVGTYSTLSTPALPDDVIAHSRISEIFFM
jgi:hypothetical protein